jgi:hypothetical protein
MTDGTSKLNYPSCGNPTVRIVVAVATTVLALTGVIQPTFLGAAEPKQENREIPKPDLTQYPKNLVRNHIEAGIEVYGESPRTEKLILSEKTQDKNKAQIALLADDPTIGYPIATGTTALVFTLLESTIVRRIQYLNQSVAGTMSVFGSKEDLEWDSPEWVPLIRNVSVGGKPSINIPLPTSELTFLKVEFLASTEGRISGLAVFGDATIEDFVADRDDGIKPERSEKTRVDYDFASLYAGARVHYMSSSMDLRTVSASIDDSALSSTAFSADDEYPTIVIDLGRSQSVNRVAVLTSQATGVIEIFLRDARGDDGVGSGSDGKSTVPPAAQKQTYRGDIIVEPGSPTPMSAMDGAKIARVANQEAGKKPDEEESREYAPVARVEDEQGVMRKSADFDARPARFVMIRFKPSQQVQSSGPFLIMDISAFGEVKEDAGRLGAVYTVPIIPSGELKSLGVPVPPAPADEPDDDVRRRVPPSSP